MHARKVKGAVLLRQLLLGGSDRAVCAKLAACTVR